MCCLLFSFHCQSILQLAFTCSKLTIKPRTRCEICWKLTTKTYFTPCSSVFVVNFEHVIAGWTWMMIHLKNTSTQWFFIIWNIYYNKKVYLFQLVAFKIYAIMKRVYCFHWLPWASSGSSHWWVFLKST